jgi:hypothetical protein
MLVGGLLVPAHLRTINVTVLQVAGENSPGLIERGQELLDAQQLGAAECLLLASQQMQLPGTREFATAVTNLAVQDSALHFWGAPPPKGLALPSSSSGYDPLSRREGLTGILGSGTAPITDLLVLRGNRERAIEWLRTSTEPDVQDLLRCQALTNTVIFSPSRSASGQAFDTAMALVGLLLQNQHLKSNLRLQIFRAGLRARNHNDSETLEQMLLDVMSLGQRMNFGQLATFLAHIEDAKTLHILADHIRNAEKDLLLMYSVMELSRNPSGIGDYLIESGSPGLQDLGMSRRWGSGAVSMLLNNPKSLSSSPFERYAPALPVMDAWARLGASVYLRSPGLALAAKWMLYFLSGFFIAAAMRFARRPVTPLEQPLQVGGLHFAREGLFALGYLVIVILLSEPFLFQGVQEVESHLKLRLPTAGGATETGAQAIDRSIMNQGTLLAFGLFFVLQGLIYAACVIKLAEIRRQKVPARMKLKLLENEEHLFDAGLYLGFVGTIISLILVSIGITHFSLMAAYSSTSLGIIFVSFFKIVHLRNARRKLLLQAESAGPRPLRASVAPAAPARS